MVGPQFVLPLESGPVGTVGLRWVFTTRVGQNQGHWGAVALKTTDIHAALHVCSGHRYKMMSRFPDGSLS